MSLAMIVNTGSAWEVCFREQYYEAPTLRDARELAKQKGGDYLIWSHNGVEVTEDLVNGETRVESVDWL